ncbi:MAG: SMC family ATPase [Nocardioidaceae bacterium]
MRLHSLTLSAFGPFPGTETIDFDSLNDAGLFLISGATGAGKTTVLDACCFALFGQVPGARGVKRLRSNHAPADVKPEVELEFSLGGRRFRIRRNPQWQRPKRHGEGTTTEHAAASLFEIDASGERLISARAQEVGHEMSHLLGMTAAQFQQVALLPQGEFATFLHASSQERQTVLEQLFQTQRFSRIEQWIHEHARRLRDEAVGGEFAVTRTVAALAERMATEVPESLTGDALVRAAELDQVLPWAGELIREAQTAATAAASTNDAAAEAHAVAGAVAASARQSAAAREALGRAQAIADSLGDLGDDVVAELDSRLGLLRGLAPTEESLRAANARVGSLEAELAAAEATVATLARERSEAPARRAALERSVLELTKSASQHAGLERELAAAEAVAQAAARVPAAESRVEACARAELAARELHVAARERLVEVVEQRLSGMAAELAAGLRDGEPCDVCGSTAHPDPARPGQVVVSEAEQNDAQSAVDRASAAYEEAQQALQAAEVTLAGLRAQAGDHDAATAAELAAATRAALDDAIDAAAALPERQRELAAVVEAADRLDIAVSEATKSVTGLTERLVAARDQAETLSRRLTEVLGEYETVACAVAATEAARVEQAERAEALRQARAVLDDPELRAQAARPGDPEATARAEEAARAASEAAAEAHHLARDRAAAVAGLLDRLAAALAEWSPARSKYLTAHDLAQLVRGQSPDNQHQIRLSAYVLAARLDQVVAAANERLALMREQRYLLERTGAAARKGSQAGLGLIVHDQWTGDDRDPATLSGGESFVVSLALALGLSDVITQEAGGVELSTLFIDEGFGMLDADTLDDVIDRLDALRAGGRTVGVVSHVAELSTRIPTQLKVIKGRDGSTLRVDPISA